MITTVTLNTSVDKAYEINDTLECGSVMRVVKCRNTAGGKGLNVSRVIKVCGEDVQATGLIGGYTGKYFEELLEKDGITNKFINVDAETRCCVNVLEKSGRSTEFLELGNEVSKEDVDKFIEEFKVIIQESDVITLSGSVPKGIDSSIYKTLIDIAKGYNKKVILDTSGVYLEKGIEALPTMIKPNDEELSNLLNKKILSRDDVIEAGKNLFAKGIENVVISLGKDGALLICDEGIFHGIPPVINAVNTVGCGDSMVAGFAVSFERGYNNEEALRYAVSVSAANAMNKNTGDFNKEDFDYIFPKVVVNKIG